MVEMDAEDAGWVALTVTVADKATKEALGTFQLLVQHPQPFQPYHCRLVLFAFLRKQPKAQDPAGIVLYVTIICKGSFIPHCDGLSYVALEVLLQGLSAPLANPIRAIVAVARVMTNVHECKHHMEKHPIAWPGICTTTVTFLDPPAAAFSITRAANHGCPQMSQPAGSPEQPTWDTSFLFQGQDVATIFSKDTALVIEYYPHKARAGSTQQQDVHGWPRYAGHGPQNHVWDHPNHGALPAAPSIERPATFLTLSGSSALPSLDPTATSTIKRHEELQAAPVHPFNCQLHRDNVSLPAADAVARKQPFPCGLGALSEKWRPPEIIGDHKELVSAKETGGAGDSGGPGGDSSVPEVGPGSHGDRSQAAVSSTLPEVRSYCLALKRMAGDLLSLRQHVASLEVENRHLRRRLASQEELGHALLTDVDLDVMTREELLDRLATLKHKLAASTAELRRLKDRVQQLQNELIRKNDREKDLVLLQQAHQQQQATLRRCQEKVVKTKVLEEIVRQQEKVIKVMEWMLQEKLTRVGRSSEKPVGEVLSREVYTMLLAENHRMQEELEGHPYPLPPITPQPPALLGGFGGTEKLCLLARLEEAQVRGQVLERQLEEVARRWGREKHELGTRLLEEEHGFPHAPTSNLPVIPTAPLRRSQPMALLP